MQTILGMIKSECANYDTEMNNIRNHCCINFSEDKDKEYQCNYYKEDNFRCDYFENNVLPLDKQLEAVYYAELEAKANGTEITKTEKKKIIKENTIIAICEKCKMEFKPKSSNKKIKLCNKCRKENQRERNKNNNKKFRKKNS